MGGMNPGTKPSPSHDDPEEHRNDVKSCCVRQVMPSRVITESGLMAPTIGVK